jgi:hypothetical protein
MSQKPMIGIFPVNPVKDLIKRVLAGNTSQLYRRIKNPKSGWTALRLKRFPTSADEANNPQRVRRNGP